MLFALLACRAPLSEGEVYSTETVFVVGAEGVEELDVPAGQSVSSTLAELRSAGLQAWPNGLVQGSDDDDDESFGADIAWQWHLAAMDYDDAPHDAYEDDPGEDDWKLHPWRVAVLDSGVHEGASMLRHNRVETGRDFVDDDHDPDDEHGHGTHVATLIGGFADLYGVAPGVRILPVRVLDEDNRGTEADLIAGIGYAVEQGADVLNLSLTFPAGYTPSPALIEALDEAADAGIVLVGAAGNDGAGEVLWPAASPHVIAVAASITSADGEPVLTDYATAGPGVDLMAPGGDLSVDRDGDGYGDGILGEDREGPVFMAGSSQAAALVSGAAVLLLEEGASPEEVTLALQAQAYEGGDEGAEVGAGAGQLWLKEAVKLVRHDHAAIPETRRTYAALMPFLADTAGGVAPAGLVAVLDETGAPRAGVEIWGHHTGTSGGSFSCTTGADGSCVLQGDPVAGSGVAWRIQVDAVVATAADGSAIYERPRTAFVMTDQLELVLDAMKEDGGYEGALLAVYWPESTHTELGDVAEGYSVWDWGSGLVTNPLGVVFDPGAIGSAGSETTASLDLDGSGLVTNPLGVIDLRVLELDGSGLVTNPLGFEVLTLAGLDGTGLVTNPLGFDPVDLVVPGGAGLVTNPLGLGDPIGLPSGGPMNGTSIAGTNVDDLLEGGGNLTKEGWPAASHLAGSGLSSELTAASGEDAGASWTGATEAF